MTEVESSGASERGAPIAHVGVFGWPDAAIRVLALAARTDAARTDVQLVVLAPTAHDVTALHAALRLLPAGQEPRAHTTALSAPRRARRIAAASAGIGPVVITTPAILRDLVTASALKLEAVTAVLLVGLDEMEPDAEILRTVLAEVPRGGERVALLGAESEFTTQILTEHFHGVRRLRPAPVPVAWHDESAQERAITVEVRVIREGAGPELLADILELTDAPSAAVVPADEQVAARAAAALDSAGYGDSSLARVAASGDVAGAALAVLVGLPSAAVWNTLAHPASAQAQPPARVVALFTAREKSRFAAQFPLVQLTPFQPSAALLASRAAEEATRERLRRVLQEGMPSREITAIEPLLAEYDAVELAGAALRLYERELARSAAQAKAVAPPTSEAPARSPRAPGGFKRDDRSPRGERPAFKRDDREPRRERPAFGSDDRGPRRERPPFGRDDRGGDRDRPPRGRPPRDRDSRDRDPRDRPPRRPPR